MTVHPTTVHDERVRAAALALLRAGVVMPAEAAGLAGVSRQLVMHWAARAGVDWRAARDEYLVQEWSRRIKRWHQ